jgi:hypothetical protein
LANRLLEAEKNMAIILSTDISFRPSFIRALVDWFEQGVRTKPQIPVAD